MIFCFSGTGNSQHAARVIATALGETLLPIAHELDKPAPDLYYPLREGETVGIVFPIHAWGPPRLVLDFISRLKVDGHPYIFSVSTCGDEEGNATKLLQKALVRRGLTLASAFCLKMPNNYIAGFDVDPQELATTKISQAENQLMLINAVIAERKTGVFDLCPGSLPGLKSHLINPLFNRFAMSTRPFFANDDCTSCGLCERICPVHTIKVDGKPQWGKACTQCLACIHHCPVRAIQYGKGTASKGRYVYPEKLADT